MRKAALLTALLSLASTAAPARAQTDESGPSAPVGERDTSAGSATAGPADGVQAVEDPDPSSLDEPVSAPVQVTARDPDSAADGAPDSQAAEPGDRLAHLGSYEKQALDAALEVRAGLELDHQPAGKVLRRIHVVNQAVFDNNSGVIGLFNKLHRTTREDIIEREVLLRPGQVWDEAVIDDTTRRLRDPRTTALVVIVPIETGEDGYVDLLVVTRDLWSLRLNSDYELQNGELTSLIIAPAEANLLGLRKELAFLFQLDQGSYALGPYYLDPNIAGTRLYLDARPAIAFSRDTGDYEGSRTDVKMAYPLWSLRRRWGASATVSHYNDVRREFEGEGLRGVDLEATPDTVESVPFVYDRQRTLINVNAVRALGNDTKHYVTTGYEFLLVRPSFYGADPTPDQCAGLALDDCLQGYRAEHLPRSERSSSVYLEYSMFTPDFRTFRNVDTYDLPEERQIGPDARVGIAVASSLLGSERNYLRFFGRLAYSLPLGEGGFLVAATEGQSRLQDGQLIDNLLLGRVSLAAPMLADAVRFTARGEIAGYINETDNRFFSIGGESGLRGFVIGAFQGEKRVVGNVELRSRPVHAWFARLGLLAFWDLGHADDDFNALRLQHDVGFGVRAVVPQLQTAVIRFDWAVPLTGEQRGLPGRFILGFEQVFNVIGSSPLPDATLR
ncbi:outer membrane protein [Haliangium ochraceum]|uniref:Putative outer membrane protein n=1 Tax=Haliangium ochraceum (strain DSM 14365 / JCM 11303 / SMP-2) TaxID=502025 RepID=D0LWK9_HALO1|nr:outer membrane protein [Haliangium ochraceum]ACY17659.1 putative outer membrane protein [Haliangium ochraceum DSM 14365]